MTVSSLFVKVPVLSEHSTSIEAASSSVDKRVGNTPTVAKARAPTAAASVNVAGNATGIEARIAAKISEMISVVERWRAYIRVCAAQAWRSVRVDSGPIRLRSCTSSCTNRRLA